MNEDQFYYRNYDQPTLLFFLMITALSIQLLGELYLILWWLYRLNQYLYLLISPDFLQEQGLNYYYLLIQTEHRQEHPEFFLLIYRIHLKFFPSVCCLLFNSLILTFNALTFSAYTSLERIFFFNNSLSSSLICLLAL